MNQRKPNIKPIKDAEYDQFAKELALPKVLRELKTEDAFSKEWKVDTSTLWAWKQTEDFWRKVNEYRDQWTRERTSDVLHHLYERIRKYGTAAEVKLWMEVVERWIEKKEITQMPENENIARQTVKVIKKHFPELLEELKDEDSSASS